MTVEYAVSLWRGELAIRRGPTMAQIAAEVAAKHGLTVEELRGPARGFKVAHPRQEAMARMRAETSQSLTAIGRYFGRDHTTVMHGVRTHNAAEADLKAWREFGLPKTKDGLK